MVHSLLCSLRYAGIATLLIVFILQTSSAQVMQSNNYKIQSDSINTGGGLSSSASYGLEDTAGEVATGEGVSTNYQLKAGYQQMQEVYLSLSAATNVLLTPNLPGITGGTATGSTAFLVTTDSAAGYRVTIQASTSPAMQSGVGTIADYVPVGAVPDFIFTTNPSSVHFAYSPEGVDTAVRFLDSGGVCGVAGSETSLRCWDGLSTTPREITRRTSGNHPNGATTTIQFRLGIGGTVPVIAGLYTATTTITAITL